MQQAIQQLMMDTAGPYALPCRAPSGHDLGNEARRASCTAY